MPTTREPKLGEFREYSVSAREAPDKATFNPRARSEKLGSLSISGSHRLKVIWANSTAANPPATSAVKPDTASMKPASSLSLNGAIVKPPAADARTRKASHSRRQNVVALPMPENEFALDEPRPDPASLISGVFQFGHDYEMFHDIDILGGYVQDRASRAVVAVVPDFPDDEFVTRAGRWRIAVKRRGRAAGQSSPAPRPAQIPSGDRDDAMRSEPRARGERGRGRWPLTS